MMFGLDNHLPKPINNLIIKLRTNKQPIQINVAFNQSNKINKLLLIIRNKTSIMINAPTPNLKQRIKNKKRLIDVIIVMIQFNTKRRVTNKVLRESLLQYRNHLEEQMPMQMYLHFC